MSPSIVLVETSHPGNIGSVARIMDNMGLSDLRLVNPCNFKSKDAQKMATHASWILDEAKVFSDLKSALKGTSLAIGTTARERRFLNSIFSLWELNDNLPASLKSRAAGELAFVFGREKTGLTNEELSLCSKFINIPTFGKNSSLNLAQAVCLVSYEVSKFYHLDSVGSEKEKDDIPNFEEVEGLKDHWHQVMEEIAFYKPGKTGSVKEKMGNWIGKAGLEKDDVNLLRAFLNKVRVKLGTKKLL